MLKHNTKKFREIGSLLDEAKASAIRYRQLTGKPLGITAEVAEYEAARHMKCCLLPARNPGHDIIDSNGKRVQVKGRVIYNNKTQKVPTIAPSTPSKPWDYILLVLLDDQYCAYEIYKLDENLLEEFLAKPRLNGSSRNRSVSVLKFKEWSGDPVWKK